MTMISVVVCAKNEEGVLEDCLKHLSSQILEPEIVVVDGHSTDNTYNIARKYADIVVKDNKKGVGDARNVGWKNASEDIVAYCDADCRPERDWTKKIYEMVGDNICISGPLVPYDNGGKVRINLKVWTNYAFRVINYIHYPCICGPNMAFKRKALEKIPFRLNIIEDFDIGNRMKKVGNVDFLKNLKMPILTRRFEKSFYRTILKYYIANYFRLKLLKRTKESGYW